MSALPPFYIYSTHGLAAIHACKRYKAYPDLFLPVDLACNMVLQCFAQIMQYVAGGLAALVTDPEFAETSGEVQCQEDTIEVM